MKPLINSVNDIIFKVFKRHNPIYAELLINWSRIVGTKFSLKSHPLKITTDWEKGQKINIVFIKVDNASISMEMSFQQDIIMERIAVYFGYKAIHKIKIIL